MKKQSLKIILTVIWLLAAGICYSCSHVPSHSTEYRSGSWNFQMIQKIPRKRLQVMTARRVIRQFCMYMYAGEIQNPGVWELRPGDRTFPGH